MMTDVEQISLSPYFRIISEIDPLVWTGEVTEMVGLLVESRGPAVAVGNFCEVISRKGKVIRTQVVGFRNGRVLSIPLEETDGVQLGDKVIARAEDSRVGVGNDLLGRVRPHLHQAHRGAVQPPARHPLGGME